MGERNTDDSGCHQKARRESRHSVSKKIKDDNRQKPGKVIKTLSDMKTRLKFAYKEIDAPKAVHGKQKRCLIEGVDKTQQRQQSCRPGRKKQMDWRDTKGNACQNT